MDQKTGKIAYLDGIRGTAALCVFFHHFLLTFYSAYATFNTDASHLNNFEIKYGKSVLSVFTNGLFCVNIFFVLSGYVLSRNYFIKNNYAILVSAAQRRFLRLYMPVAFTLILSFLLLKSGLYYNVPVSKITHSEWWLGGFWTFTGQLSKLLHCLLIGTMFQGDSTFDTSMWTMSVELYGSLLVFAFLALTNNTRNRLATLGCLFLFFMLTGRENYTTFLFGISLNYIEVFSLKMKNSTRAILCICCIIPAFALGSFPARFEVSNTIFAHLPDSILALHEWFPVIGAYLFVLAFVLSPGLQHFISRRFFRFLGHISFSFYLIHPLIIGSFSCFLFLKLNAHIGYVYCTILVFILSAPVAMFVSWLMAKYIDAPGMRLSKYVYEKWIKKA